MSSSQEQKMATVATKKGKKNKWKPFNANIIIDATRKPSSNWADDSEDFDKDLLDNPPKVVLPSAPRASRDTSIDESKVPTVGPFQAYLSNIPYDLIEDELAALFQDLKIKNIRLPKEERTNRAKGFGYIEFEDRASLCTALSLGDPMLKGRIIKIELSTNADSGGRGGNRGRGNRDGGRDQTSSDRTTGNWRTGPRQEEEDRGYDRGGFSGGRRDFGSGGGGGGGSSSSSGYGRGGFDREDRFPRDENRFDRGGREDRGRDDRGGFSRERFGENQNRPFGRERDGGSFGGDRGSSGFRDRAGRDEERHSRYDDRESGTSRGGQWREEPRENRGFGGGGGSGGGNRFENRDRDGKYGPPARRDDLPPPERGADRESRTRPKLALQPRTKPKETPESAATSTSIFGGAKPVDTAAREREIEERLMRNDEYPESRSRGGPGSTGSRGSDKPLSSNEDKKNDEKRVEPAPPPKENAWAARRPAQTMLNNGRSSPEDENVDSHKDFNNRSEDLDKNSELPGIEQV